MGKTEGETTDDADITDRGGAHAPSRVGFGALAETNFVANHGAHEGHEEEVLVRRCHGVPIYTDYSPEICVNLRNLWIIIFYTQGPPAGPAGAGLPLLPRSTANPRA